MAFFTLMLDRVQVDKVREFGKAEVRFYSFVHDEQFSLPELSNLMGSANFTETRDKVRGAAQALVGRWESIEAQHIGRGHVFDFDTGKSLVRLDRIPTFLEWQMLVIESDADLRQIGQLMDKILPDNEIDSVASAVMAAAGVAASPISKAAILLAKFVFSGIAKVIRGNKDDQLGLVCQSFVRPIHFPKGNMSCALVDDLTRNMWYDYTIFGTKEF